MGIKEIRDRAMEQAKFVKERAVASAENRSGETRDLGNGCYVTPDTDIHAMVEGYRGERPVVMLQPRDLDHDLVLWAGRIVAIGFSCDTIAVTTEGWKPAQHVVNKSPLTGKPWGEGGIDHEMQVAAIEHHGLRDGWMFEALATVVVNRAGDVASGGQSYRIVDRPGGGFDIEWTERFTTDPDDSGAQAVGFIPDNLVAAMVQAKPFSAVMAQVGLTPEMFGLNFAEAEAHTDCAVIKTLPRLGWQGAAVLMAEHGSTRQRVIEESLGDHPNLVRLDENERGDQR